MRLEDVLQKIDELIAHYESMSMWGRKDKCAYHRGAFDALEELRDEINKQEGGEEMADTTETERADLMTPSKSEVKYIYEQDCFNCKWSSVDPFDWGLRCCNHDSTYCTDYTPDDRCELFEKGGEE